MAIIKEEHKMLGGHGWVEGSSIAEPYALCLFIPLIDLDDETGYTQFWLRLSQESGHLLVSGPVAGNSRSNLGWQLPRDAIWYDYRLMHRGMGNTSNAVRPGSAGPLQENMVCREEEFDGTESLRQNGL
ncbi:hypothetical protein ACHAW5_003889 [Stephanodiscus triporus]|uniref:Uncharacterized protein n=1 Tax=Stephanodiscus triporus TaxID=2934178 RepID=A0ABD3MVG9_9STRA